MQAVLSTYLLLGLTLLSIVQWGYDYVQERA